MNMIAGSGVLHNTLIFALGLLFAGCANLTQLLNQMDVKKPVISMKSANLTEISLDDATIQFNLEIENPNTFGVHLAGFDYQLDINQRAFLNGDQPDKIEIAAQNKSPLNVPVSINYVRLLDTIKDLVNRKEADYKIDFGFKFDLPVLGNTRIPITHTGTLPIPKIPDISISSLKMNKLGLTGADLELVLKIGNPNIFGFDLNNLNYNFSVNGNRWVKGMESTVGDIAAGGESLVRLPVSLNFLELGRSVADLISGGTDLNYQLTGVMDVSGKELPLQLKGVNFNRSGTVNLDK